MIRRASILISATVILIASCNFYVEDDETCPKPGRALITGIQDVRLFEAAVSDETSGTVTYNVVVPEATIPADSLMIAITTDANLRQASVSNTSSVAERIAGILIRKAHALDCQPQSFETTQQLGDITIISNAGLSASYPAGSDLSPLFKVGKQFIARFASDNLPDSIIADAPDDRETLSQFLSAQPLTPLLVALTLDVDEAIASQHVFTVTLTLVDGTVFTALSDTVNIGS